MYSWPLEMVIWRGQEGVWFLIFFFWTGRATFLMLASLIFSKAILIFSALIRAACSAWPITFVGTGVKSRSECGCWVERDKNNKPRVFLRMKKTTTKIKEFPLRIWFDLDFLNLIDIFRKEKKSVEWTQIKISAPIYIVLERKGR